MTTPNKTESATSRSMWDWPVPAPATFWRELPAELWPVASILYHRGFTHPAEAVRIARSGRTVPDDTSATRMAGMTRAVARFEQARARHERIGVLTDSDVDGVCSAAVLHLGLQALGYDPVLHIPNRTIDGYGLTTAAGKALLDEGASLIVTADCGITNFDTIAQLGQVGCDVIVTDHHAVRELPPAYATIDPHRSDCAYPYKALCGAAVAWKLVCALAEAQGRGQEECDELKDLLALATIHDRVDMKDAENHYLAAEGLRRLQQNRRLGLAVLFDELGLKAGDLNEREVFERVTSVLNTGSREPYDLLISDDEKAARHIARALIAEHERYVAAFDTVWHQAQDQVARQLANGQRGLVIGGDDWSRHGGGLLGEIAARLCREHSRPVAVFSRRRSGDGYLITMRSLNGFNSTAALTACADLLEGYGGHPRAAGAHVRSERLAEFRERLAEVCNRELTADDVRPRIRIEDTLNKNTFDERFLDAVAALRPFGQEFFPPIVALQDTPIEQSTREPNGDWRVVLRASERVVEARGSGLGDLAAQFPAGSTPTLALELSGIAEYPLTIIDVTA